MAKLLPTQVVIAAFNEQDAAEDAAKALTEAMANKEMYYNNLATVTKDPKGKLRVKEMGDINAAYAASMGFLLGGLSCVLLGPTGVAAGAAAGAVIGGAGSKALLKGSLDKDRITQLGNSLPPGSSAIIAVFDELPIEQDLWKTQQVQQVRDEVVYELAKNIGDSLSKGENVVYMYAVTPDGIMATRMASGDEANDIKGLIVTPQGVTAGRAAAADNVLVYEVAAAGEEGIEAAAGAVLVEE